MLVVFRWWYFLGIAGLGLAINGAPEFALSMRASADPVPTELAQLGTEGHIAEPHVRIGVHEAHYAKGTVVTLGTKWRRSWFYYPVGPEPFHVVARVRVQNGAPARRDVHETELVGIAEPLTEYDEREQAAVLHLVGAMDPAKVVVIERDKHPNLVAALAKLAGSIFFLTWAARRFFRTPATHPQSR